MLGDSLKYLTGEALRSPVRHSNPPARAADAHEFSRSQPRTRREHRPEHADDYIKGCIRVGKLLGVAFVKLNLYPLGFGALSPVFEYIRGDVNACHGCADARRCYRYIAAAARHVKQARARLQRQPVDKLLRARLSTLRYKAVVTGHPRGLEAGFQRFHLRCDRVHDSSP